LHIGATLNIGDAGYEPVVDETAQHPLIRELSCLVGVAEVEDLRAVVVQRPIVIRQIEGVDARRIVEIRR
jgi:hypothetical protein